MKPDVLFQPGCNPSPENVVGQDLRLIIPGRRGDRYTLDHFCLPPDWQSAKAALSEASYLQFWQQLAADCEHTSFRPAHLLVWQETGLLLGASVYKTDNPWGPQFGFSNTWSFSNQKGNQPASYELYSTTTSDQLAVMFNCAGSYWNMFAQELGIELRMPRIEARLLELSGELVRHYQVSGLRLPPIARNIILPSDFSSRLDKQAANIAGQFVGPRELEVDIDHILRRVGFKDGVSLQLRDGEYQQLETSPEGFNLPQVLACYSTVASYINQILYT